MALSAGWLCQLPVCSPVLHPKAPLLPLLFMATYLLRRKKRLYISLSSKLIPQSGCVVCFPNDVVTLASHRDFSQGNPRHSTSAVYRSIELCSTRGMKAASTDQSL